MNQRLASLIRGGMSYAAGGIPDCTLKAMQSQVLPEEIITDQGRWTSIKKLPSGDIAIKAVRYDRDLVSLVRTVARRRG